MVAKSSDMGYYISCCWFLFFRAAGKKNPIAGCAIGEFFNQTITTTTTTTTMRKV